MSSRGKLLACVGGAVFTAGTFAMALQWMRRPIFIDEPVYMGQYLFHILNEHQTVFWVVDTKQPLLFWIETLIYWILPRSISDGPLFMLGLGRLLSPVLILLSTVVLAGTAPSSGERSRFTRFSRWGAVACVFLASTFIQVHSQLLMVEPLLLLCASLHLYFFERALRTGHGTEWLWLSGFLLILTKTNALFVLLGIEAACALPALKSRSDRGLYRQILKRNGLCLVAGILFFVLSPRIRMEAGHVMKFPGFHPWAILMRFENITALAGYFLPACGVVSLVAGFAEIARRRQTNGRWLVFVVSLGLTSAFSCLASILSMEGGYPRYHLMTFYPWLVFACVAFARAIDQMDQLENWKRPLAAAFCTAIAAAVAFDLQSAWPALQDARVPPLRTTALDRYQYYDHFATESVADLAKKLVDEDAQVYAQAPLYTTGLTMRAVLGFRELGRLRWLPDGVSAMNQIPCDPTHRPTYLLLESWTYPSASILELRNVDEIHQYRSGAPDGLSFTLYKMRCL